MKKAGIIGSGIVAQVLATGFTKHGFKVMMGTSNVEKLNTWKKEHQVDVSIGSMQQAAAFGDVVVLAVKGTAAETIVTNVRNEISGKTVIDTTNPIADEPPVNGVIRYFTKADESLMQRLQNIAPDAHFVKAFNSVGNPFMVDPAFPGGKPTMFICGNDASAKSEVTEILNEFGWEVEDMGLVESAQPIESLCILWCIPGFIRNEWMHAFKLLKMKS